MIKKVYILDFNEIDRRVLKNIVMVLPSVDVVGENNRAANALVEMRHLQPHIIFIDLILPRMSGYEVARRIISVLPNSFLIATSRIFENQLVLNCYDHGFNEFLQKPYDQKRLKTMLTFAAGSVSDVVTTDEPKDKPL